MAKAASEMTWADEGPGGSRLFYRGHMVGLVICGWGSCGRWHCETTIDNGWDTGEAETMELAKAATERQVQHYIDKGFNPKPLEKV